MEAGVIIMRKLLGPKAQEVEIPNLEDSFQDAETDTQTQSQAGGTQAGGSAENVNRNVNQESSQAIVARKEEEIIKPCRYFRSGKCKFGRNCRFLHGNICKKYQRPGSFEYGCKEGQKCAKVHVILCKNSKKNKECPDQENCGFKYHIRNPKYKSSLEKSHKKEENKLPLYPSQSPFLGHSHMDQRMYLLEQQVGSMVPMLKTLLNCLQQDKNWGANPNLMSGLLSQRNN